MARRNTFWSGLKITFLKWINAFVLRFANRDDKKIRLFWRGKCFCNGFRRRMQYSLKMLHFLIFMNYVINAEIILTNHWIIPIIRSNSMNYWVIRLFVNKGGVFDWGGVFDPKIPWCHVLDQDFFENSRNLRAYWYTPPKSW